MARSMVWKARIGAVAALATLLLVMTSHADARTTAAADVRYLQAAGVLVMPFDVTSGRVSFQIVSRMGGSFGGLPVRTHWVYYAADCRHLADVFISLTALDTVVVDPTHLQGQTQTQDPLENHPEGPTVDLSGERGVVIVTAFDPAGAIVPQIVGGWTIANAAIGTSFGGDAIGVSSDGSLPDPAVLAGGIRVPTFNPATLTSSQIIMIGLESDGGEVHPITRPSAALRGAHVCCSASVTDNLEVTASVPDVCFDCVEFTAITPELADVGEHALLPDTLALASVGFVRLSSCQSATGGGGTALVGTGDAEQFLVVLHGQSVGPFGVVVTGKYSGASAF
ncbi:MAG: hypothetical protein HY271_14575 [Deltaproteobacteria bacterium]|nr:hypothetical protein [Deltaproteobacteria bacterium]